MAVFVLTGKFFIQRKFDIRKVQKKGRSCLGNAYLTKDFLNMETVANPARLNAHGGGFDPTYS